MGLVKTIKIWKCDHCGKEEAWNDSWRTRWAFFGRGYAAYEEDVVACSAECGEALDKLSKPALKKKLHKMRSGSND